MNSSFVCLVERTQRLKNFTHQNLNIHKLVVSKNHKETRYNLGQVIQNIQPSSHNRRSSTIHNTILHMARDVTLYMYFLKDNLTLRPLEALPKSLAMILALVIIMPSSKLNYFTPLNKTPQIDSSNMKK